MLALDARIDAIRTQTGIDVLALDDRMLDQGGGRPVRGSFGGTAKPPDFGFPRQAMILYYMDCLDFWKGLSEPPGESDEESGMGKEASSTPS